MIKAPTDEKCEPPDATAAGQAHASCMHHDGLSCRRHAAEMGCTSGRRRLIPIAAGNQLAFESVLLNADELRVSLRIAKPSTLEELAVERVVTSWIEVNYLNCKYPADAGKNLSMAHYVIPLKDSAQRRFNDAVKSLQLGQAELAQTTAPLVLKKRTGT